MRINLTILQEDIRKAICYRPKKTYVIAEPGPCGSMDPSRKQEQPSQTNRLHPHYPGPDATADCPPEASSQPPTRSSERPKATSAKPLPPPTKRKPSSRHAPYKSVSKAWQSKPIATQSSRKQGQGKSLGGIARWGEGRNKTDGKDIARRHAASGGIAGQGTRRPEMKSGMR